MQVVILVAVLLLSWSWLMGPEARANLAPFDPNDPRFAPKEDQKNNPAEAPEDKESKKNRNEKKTEKSKPTRNNKK